MAEIGLCEGFAELYLAAMWAASILFWRGLLSTLKEQHRLNFARFLAAKFRELKFRNSVVSKPREFEPKFRTRKILKSYGVKYGARF